MPASLRKYDTLWKKNVLLLPFRVVIAAILPANYLKLAVLIPRIQTTQPLPSVSTEGTPTKKKKTSLLLILLEEHFLSEKDTRFCGVLRISVQSSSRVTH